MKLHQSMNCSTIQPSTPSAGSYCWALSVCANTFLKPEPSLLQKKNPMHLLYFI
jgi:hypothetical protein